MKRLMGTAALALTLGLGAPAVAQDSQLAAQVENFLMEHGYTEVNASMLTTEQLAQLQGLEERDVPDSQVEGSIDEILVMDAGTSMYVSEEMRAMMDEDGSAALIRNAREILAEAGHDPALADQLSTEQLAQIWFLREREDSDNPATLESRLDAILNQV